MANDVLMTGQALDLDGIRARLKQDAGGRGRDIPALAGGQKRQIGNDEKVRRPAADGRDMGAQHLDRGVDGGRKAMDDHGGAVAHEDGVDRRRRHEPGHQRIIRRDDDERTLFPPGAGKIKNGLHAAGGFSVNGRPAGR